MDLPLPLRPTIPTLIPGATAKLAHAPIRISLTAHHLETPDMTYTNQSDTVTRGCPGGGAVSGDAGSTGADKGLDPGPGRPGRSRVALGDRNLAQATTKQTPPSLVGTGGPLISWPPEPDARTDLGDLGSCGLITSQNFEQIGAVVTSMAEPWSTVAF